jgi:hypothetical protein
MAMTNPREKEAIMGLRGKGAPGAMSGEARNRQILGIVARHPEGTTASAVAREAGVHPTTIIYPVQGLIRRGKLRVEGVHSYRRIFPL